MNPDLEHVLDELLGDTPYTVELVANPHFGHSGSVTFDEISRATAAHGEIAIGWVTSDGGLKLSPPKSQSLCHAELQQVVVFTRPRTE